LHGIDVEGGEFKYDDTERLSKTALVELLVKLNKIGKIPYDYIEKHLGIKLSREEQPSEGSQDEEEPEEEKETEEKKKDKLSVKRYNKACQCAQEPFSVLTLMLSEEEENKLIERIYNDRLNGEFDPTYFNELANGLVQ
jgi:hypothetical protein